MVSSDDQPKIKPMRRSPLLLRGESAVASMGLALATILLLALAGCGYWLITLQRDALARLHQQQVAAVADVMAPAAEQLLTARRPTPVRRMLVDVAKQYQLTTCRIVLADGEVIADADPSRITVTSVTRPRAQAESDNQPAPRASRFEESVTVVSGGMLVVSRPLLLEGHMPARLEFLGDARGPQPVLWEAQAGVGLVGAAALAALLLVYRQFRRRMQAMGMIRESLLAMHRGESAASALAVGGDLGPEALVWNDLLQRQEALQRAAVVETASKAQGGMMSGDLSSGCDAVSHGLMLVDEVGKITYANHAAGVYLQKQREAMVGLSIDELIEDAPLATVIRQAAGGEVRRRITQETQRSDDASGVLRFSIHPVRRGEGNTAMIVIDDITQQRVAEGASHQFVAQATHELRTPLTNIRLYLETIQEDEKDDPALRAQCLNVIGEEALRLERLVGDMLSVAEIESGSLQIEQDDVRLDQLLHDVEASYQAAADQKQIMLAFKLPPKLPIVQGDRDKIMLALQNLVGNAIKYTEPGGQVSVAAESGEGRVSVEISDTGIGIAPDDAQHIFEKFYRARDKRLGKIAGSGLGLALAREVIRLHGGDVTVHSQLDHGSTFTMTLPAREDADTATE